MPFAVLDLSIWFVFFQACLSVVIFGHVIHEVTIN